MYSIPYPERKSKGFWRFFKCCPQLNVKGAPPPTPSPKGRGLFCGGCAPCTPLCGAAAPPLCGGLPPRRGGAGGALRGGCAPCTLLCGAAAPYPLCEAYSPPRREGAFLRGLRPLHPALWGCRPTPLCEAYSPEGRGLFCGGCAPCTPLCGAAAPHPFVRLTPRREGGFGGCAPAPRFVGLPPHTS